MNCSTCAFWAAFGDESGKGECGMIVEQESRVQIIPLVRTANSPAFRPIKVDDKEVPSGWSFRAAMVTPPDFHCEAYQEKDFIDREHLIGEDDPDDPTLAADWWKQ